MDLAGSESANRTNGTEILLNESKNINKSLLTLGMVIRELIKGQDLVSYRSSSLTKILKESLGGNARTAIIICCSTAKGNVSETKSTLKFGTSAKAVKNKAHVNHKFLTEELKKHLEIERNEHVESINSLNSQINLQKEAFQKMYSKYSVLQTENKKKEEKVFFVFLFLFWISLPFHGF